MKDLDPKFQSSELQAELLKATSYQKGKTVGSQAGEPPAALNRVTRISFQPSSEAEFRISSWEKQYRYEPRVHEEPIPEKIAYRQGYFDGIREFLAQHDISFREAGAFNFPDVLTSKAGFDGLVQGLNRRKPAVGRDYTRRRDDKLSYKYEPEPEWIVRQRFSVSQTLGGYELGFILSLTRDFGVKLNYLEVPRDDMAYEAFMQGLSGESRQIPLRRDLSKEKYYLIEESPQEIFEMVDNDAYLAGLKVWLATQHLGHIEAWQVRHPEALRAFKAALEGRVLAEYEPREPVIPTPPYKEELIKNYLRKDPFEKWYLPPSPSKEFRREGASGYSLGKTARELRQTLGASAKISSTSQ